MQKDVNLPNPQTLILQTFLTYAVNFDNLTGAEFALLLLYTDQQRQPPTHPTTKENSVIAQATKSSVINYGKPVTEDDKLTLQ